MKTVFVRTLALERLTHFYANGNRRELKEPDGLATSRQLRKLNALRLLAVVEPGQVVLPLSKGEAAYAIGVTTALTDERGCFLSAVDQPNPARLSGDTRDE